MRDTNALQAARTNERDPYARQFPFPKRIGTVTVLDEPSLFRRLPEFADWNKDRHIAASQAYLDAYLAERAVYNDLVRRYAVVCGTTGALISGGFHDTWPDYAKDACRFFAHRVTDFADKSLAHWRASGRQAARWQLNRDQAREHYEVKP